jgi:hypothetical protein
MNLDLLKKLTRLANNNPNDNEANLAARKVCKMLEEANWSLNGARPIQKNEPSIKPMTPDEVMHEILRRKQEQERQAYKYWSDPFYQPFVGRETQTPKPPKEKRPLECTQCHQMIETAYMGNLYICITCVWQNYQARSK